MYCRQCGTQIPDDSVYCPACSVKLTPQTATRTGRAAAARPAVTTPPRPGNVVPVSPERQAFNAAKKANDVANVGLGCGCLGVILLLILVFIVWLASKAGWPVIVVLGCLFLFAIIGVAKKLSA